MQTLMLKLTREEKDKRSKDLLKRPNLLVLLQNKNMISLIRLKILTILHRSKLTPQNQATPLLNPKMKI